jgi:hypothetical protein
MQEYIDEEVVYYYDFHSTEDDLLGQSSPQSRITMVSWSFMALTPCRGPPPRSPSSWRASASLSYSRARSSHWRTPSQMHDGTCWHPLSWQERQPSPRCAYSPTPPFCAAIGPSRPILMSYGRSFHRTSLHWPLSGVRPPSTHRCSCHLRHLSHL